MVEYLQYFAVVKFGFDDVEFPANFFVHCTWLDFIDKFRKMVFECVDIAKSHVNSDLDKVLDSMADVLQCLLSEFSRPHLQNSFFNFGDDIMFVFVVMSCDSTDNTFEHENVFDFGDIWYKYFLVSEVSHFLVGSAVAVHDSPAIEVV